MSGDDNSKQLRQLCDDWLQQRDRLLQAKTKARAEYGAHVLLKPSAFDPECLAEPLRSLAMRALGYPEDRIAGITTGRTFTDFARKHTTRGDLGESPCNFQAEF